MLLTISNLSSPATDLGFLLHKHPDRCQSFDLAFGRAHVFYSEASDERCTAALLLDIDPIGLTRSRRGGKSGSAMFGQYVNDRPYAVSSFMSVAIAQVFGTALAGRCAARPDAVAAPLLLEACLAPLPSRGGADPIRRLFEPLGYEVSIEPHPLDSTVPGWGDGPYFTLTLRATTRLQDLLSHLYVLIPVLDDTKHYWVGDDEVEKLLRHGETWLGKHPEREMIVQRYLRHQRTLTSAALARISSDEDPDPDLTEEAHNAEEEAVEERISLHQQRLGAVLASLRSSGARTVLDLGCGEGRLLDMLAREKQFTEIVGLDVSLRSLERAQRRLRRLAPRQQDRVQLLHGSLTYRDRRLAAYDAAAVVEVIEHLDVPRLVAFERVLFEYAHPRWVILTTPNVEYNVKFERLPAGRFRHRDHRFEWTRAEFQAWAGTTAQRHGYSAQFLPIGPEDPVVGAPSQMAVFAAE
jgi:3' terminal RNA ribose 2'-O-methyltransferase Hen1